jgi:hypothetical protein
MQSSIATHPMGYTGRMPLSKARRVTTATGRRATMKANKIGIVILLLTQRLCWFTEDLFSLLDRDEPLPFCADLKAGAPQWSAR